MDIYFPELRALAVRIEKVMVLSEGPTDELYVCERESV